MVCLPHEWLIWLIFYGIDPAFPFFQKCSPSEKHPKKLLALGNQVSGKTLKQQQEQP